MLIKLRTLESALDKYRGQYLADRRYKSKLRAENPMLSKQLDTYKEKVEKMEFELKKKTIFHQKFQIRYRFALKIV